MLIHSKGGEQWAFDMRKKERDEVRAQLVTLCGVGPKVKEGNLSCKTAQQCHRDIVCDLHLPHIGPLAFLGRRDGSRGRFAIPETAGCLVLRV